MKKRKGLALLLSLAMIVGLLPMTAFADGGIMPDENGFLISGGMLLEYTGNAEEVVIPDTVTDIVAGFKNNAKIVKVTIPKTVKTIGQNVFSGCSALKEVVFQTDSALKNIGNNAFKGCTQLKEIKLPDSVESIGTGAFASMGYKFKTFKIPAGVTKLGTTGKDVFSGSNALSVIDVSSENQTYESYDGVIYKKADKSVYFCPPGRTGSVSIKAGTETIGENAFNNGSGKIGPDYVDIPDTVTSIANGAFENSRLISITIPGNVKTIGTKAFYNSQLQSLVLENGIESIGDRAFETCYSLTGAVIPASVTSIGNKTFEDRGSKFQCVRFESDNTVIPENILEHYIASVVSGKDPSTAKQYFDKMAAKPGNKLTWLDDSGYKKGDNIYLNKNDCDLYIEATEQLTATVNPAETSFPAVTWYSNNTNVATVSKNGLVTAIKQGEASITARTIDGIKATCIVHVIKDPSVSDFKINAEGLITGYIGEDKNITIPETVNGSAVKGIAQEAFKGSDLESAVVPGHVKTVGNSAFEDCEHLTQITLSEGIETIGNKAFYGCSVLKSVDIPGSVTAVGTRAFYGCKELNNVFWNANVAEIPEQAFASCTSLTNFKFNDKVTSIGKDAFSGAKFSNIELPVNLKHIKEGAFASTQLTTVALPEGTLTVDKFAFRNCRSLLNMKIPASVEKLGKDYVQDMFQEGQNDTGADQMTRIDVDVNNKIYKSVDGLLYSKDGSIFYFCPRALKEVKVDEGVTTIDDYAFFMCFKLEKVKLPSTLKTVKSNAFHYDEEISEMILPEGLERIEQGAFWHTEKWIPKIPSTVTYIASYAFAESGGDAFPENKNEIITVPDGISEILEFTFYGTNMNGIVLPETVTKIERSAINVAEMEHVYLPSGITEIGNEACALWKNITYVTLPKSIRKLGDKALIGSTWYPEKYILGGLFIPSSIQSIGNKILENNNADVIIFSDAATGVVKDYADANNLRFIQFSTEKAANIDIIVENVQNLTAKNDDTSSIKAVIEDRSEDADIKSIIEKKYKDIKNGYLVALDMSKNDKAYVGSGKITLSIGIPKDLQASKNLHFMQIVNGAAKELEFTRLGNRIFAQADPNGVYSLISGNSLSGSSSGSGGSSYSGNQGKLPDKPDNNNENNNSNITQFKDIKPGAWYAEGISYMVKKGLMKGVGDGKFAPDAATTRAVIVTMLHRLEGSPKALNNKFSDIVSGSWYNESVNWAADNGIVSGTSKDMFSPHSKLNREQLATILYRYAKYKGKVSSDFKVYQLNYTDSAKVSSYAYEAMCWMSMNNIIKGVDGNRLDPQGNVSRVQIATILMRFCKLIGE